MQHLPLFADLKHRAVLVVGGGVVAERRVTLAARGGRGGHGHRARADGALARARGRRPVHVTCRAPSRPTRSSRTGSSSRRPTIAPSTRPSRPRPQRPSASATSSTTRSSARSSCRPSSTARRSRSRSAAAASRPCSRAGSRASSRRCCRRASARSPSSRAAGAQRVREQVTDPTERRHFWERVVTGVVAEHAFAGRDADAEQRARARRSRAGAATTSPAAAKPISSARAPAAST